MGRLETKRHQATLRKLRTRSRIKGSTQKPRLSVHVSNKHIRAQLIDDSHSKTLVYVSSLSMPKTAKTNLTETAKLIGSELAKLAKAKKITKAIFDRGNNKYHGRIKALADAARQNGLEI